CQQGASDPPTF
nr:immunoglobulin light chain junction region [Macaca mulatta]